MVFEKKIIPNTTFSEIGLGEAFFYSSRLCMATLEVWWDDEAFEEECGANAVDLVTGKLLFVLPEEVVERANVKIVEV